MSVIAESEEKSTPNRISESVLTAIYQRWSPRAFASRNVSDHDLASLFEAARWAPSSYNEQPWRFLVGQRGSVTYQEVASSLIPFNQLWAPKAPVLVLGVTKSRFSHDNSANGYALYDLGAATALLVLQAAAQGLVAHQMGAFDHDKLRRALAIPDEFLLGTVTALGYAGDPSTLANERLLAQERAPRMRKPLDSIVFTGWNQPASLG